MKRYPSISFVRRFYAEPFVNVRIVPGECMLCLWRIKLAPYASDVRPVVIWLEVAS